MHLLNSSLRRLVLPFGALLLVVGCAGSGGAGWTYAPLGPTAAPSAAPTMTAAPSAAPSGQPSAVPSGQPSSGPAVVLELITNDDAPLVFVPNELEAPPATDVTVNYNNNSSLPHNVNFFDGPDQSAPSLGATEVVTGPNNIQSVTFTTPAETGDYYFWCDVHGTSMAGILHIR